MSTENSKDGESLVNNLANIFPEFFREQLVKRINESINYEPVIGVMGKTGAGKSSLCNAIFKDNACAVSNVEACTRDVKELVIRFENKTLKLIDIPGVGENSERDKEYEDLYRNLLPKLDLILWVIKGDDRAFSADEHFYNKIIKPAGGNEKVLFILNQADKIEPSRQWNELHNCPSPEQLVNIRKKEAYVVERFGFTEHPVISVSANEDWNISGLVEGMIRALPKHAKSGVAAQLKDDLKTASVTSNAIDGFGETIGDIIDEVIDFLPVPQAIKMVAKAAKNTVVKAAKSVWGFFFG